MATVWAGGSVLWSLKVTAVHQTPIMETVNYYYYYLSVMGWNFQKDFSDGGRLVVEPPLVHGSMYGNRRGRYEACILHTQSHWLSGELGPNA